MKRKTLGHLSPRLSIQQPGVFHSMDKYTKTISLNRIITSIKSRGFLSGLSRLQHLRIYVLHDLLEYWLFYEY